MRLDNTHLTGSRPITYVCVAMSDFDNGSGHEFLHEIGDAVKDDENRAEYKCLSGLSIGQSGRRMPSNKQIA